MVPGHMVARVGERDNGEFDDPVRGGIETGRLGIDSGLGMYSLSHCEIQKATEGSKQPVTGLAIWLGSLGRLGAYPC